MFCPEVTPVFPPVFQPVAVLGRAGQCWVSRYDFPCYAAANSHPAIYSQKLRVDWTSGGGQVMRGDPVILDWSHTDCTVITNCYQSPHTSL